MKSSRLSIAVLGAASILGGCGAQSDSTSSAPVQADPPSAPVQADPPAPAQADPPVAVEAPAHAADAVEPLPVVATASAGESINAMAAAMYARLATSPSNLVFSPASIHGAFAMATLGARGETAAELQRALAVPAGDEARLRADGALQQRWNAPRQGRTFRVVNRLFGEQTMHFEDPYLATLRESFASPLEPTDFRQGFAAARTHINDWVSTTTNQRIRDLLPPAALDASTSLVLVNAVYLDAHWAQPFEQCATHPAAFHTTQTTSVQVPTMHLRGSVQLAEVDGAQVVQLPYEGNDLAMRFILPPAGQENAWVTAAHLAAPSFSEREVVFGIPKFRIEPTESVALRDHVEALGVHQAFDEHAADFTGIATFPDPGERLYISQAYHRAFIRVDEAGTEAAAATAIVMARGGGMPMPLPEVNFDRPFLFQLVDVESGATLFLGRVTNPS